MTSSYVYIVGSAYKKYEREIVCRDDHHYGHNIDASMSEGGEEGDLARGTVILWTLATEEVFLSS